MSNTQKSVIAIVTIIVVLAGVVGALGCAWWIYFKSNPELKPTTTDITYVGKVLDTGSGEERYFMEIDYWRNDDGVGKEVFEFAFTGYTDYEFRASKARGVQFVNTNNKRLNDLENWTRRDYDRYGAISWKPLEEDTLGWGDYMYINLKGEPYGVAMKGQWEERIQYYDAWKAAGSFFTGKWNVHDRSLWYSDNIIYHNYTMLEFYQSVANSLTISSEPEGEYVLPLVEMSTFFVIGRVDDKGNIDELTETTFQDDFFAVKVRLHSGGMVKAAQSAFGVYIDDRHWTITGLNDDYLDYATVSALQTLSSEDFEYKFATGINAYVPSLRADVKARLQAAGVNKIDIRIDFDDNFWANKTTQALFLVASELLDESTDTNDFDVGVIYIKYNQAAGHIPLYIDSNIWARYKFAESDMTLENIKAAPIQKLIFDFEG